MKLSFDSACLAAVVHEMQDLVGARAQRIAAVTANSLTIEAYAGTSRHLWISWDAEFASISIARRRVELDEGTNEFARELKRRLQGARLVSAEQAGFDRVIRVRWSTEEEEFTLIGELMGKHANWMLVTDSGAVVAAAKWLGASKTRRPILPNRAYEPPPFEPRPSLLTAREGDDLRGFEGVSPLLAKLIEARGVEAVVSDIAAQRWQPVVTEAGVYPLDLSALGIPGEPAALFGEAYAEWLQNRWGTRELESRRRSLVQQLERVILAREVALRSLREVQEASTRIESTQRQGELLLAYQHQVHPGATSVELPDYDGTPLTIRLDPEKNARENAERLFSKAKRLRESAAGLGEQMDTLSRDLEDLQAVHAAVLEATDFDRLESMREVASKRRWLMAAPVVARHKEDRPYEGHRIRELLGPGGYRVLYGENSEANDYLTLRLGKPSDWWLHVRGAPSAHVLVLTGGHPEKVQPETLRFAAEIAVRNSPSKHSGYVPVDYTLKKYVRRMKGGKPGLVQYTHEKTLHVEP